MAATARASEVIARFGGQSALARSLGLNQSTVQHWAKTGQIPSWRHEQVLQAAQERGIALEWRELARRGGGGGSKGGERDARKRGPSLG
ncbi:MAG TPA: YdaS family helix-turn-helix protein, partial [Chloroflexota bacterium]|nr:YdaS family helix-turn-helix protein [Chloroflexota bacterium]